MSGGHLLWPGTAWLRMEPAWSTVKTTSGMEILLGCQGRGSLACRGSLVMGVARRARPGTRDTTWGASALLALASRPLRTPGSTIATAGNPNTRRAWVLQRGHAAGAATW